MADLRGALFTEATNQVRRPVMYRASLAVLLTFTGMTASFAVMVWVTLFRDSNWIMSVPASLVTLLALALGRVAFRMIRARKEWLATHGHPEPKAAHRHKSEGISTRTGS